jgi:hypothetical protein
MYRQTVANGLGYAFLQVGAQRLFRLPSNQQIHEIIGSIPQCFLDELRLAHPASSSNDRKLRKSMGQIPRSAQFRNLLGSTKELHSQSSSY